MILMTRKGIIDLPKKRYHYHDGDDDCSDTRDYDHDLQNNY